MSKLFELVRIWLKFLDEIMIEASLLFASMEVTFDMNQFISKFKIFYSIGKVLEMYLSDPLSVDG